MADSWEDLDEDATPIAAIPKTAFAEEDQEDSVLDSWEDQDEQEEQPATGATLPVRKKKNINQVIKERKEAEDKKLADLAAKKAAALEAAQEDPVARKLRMQKLQEEEDLKNAVDLFGSVSVKDTVAVPATAPNSGVAIPSKAPATKAEFDAASKQISSQVLSWKLKNSAYMPFLEKLMRELVEPIDYMDVRKLSSVLSTLSNEMQRLDKEKKTGKKAGAVKKASVKMETDERENFHNADEYDDFM